MFCGTSQASCCRWGVVIKHQLQRCGSWRQGQVCRFCLQRRHLCAQLPTAPSRHSWRRALLRLSSCCPVQWSVCIYQKGRRWQHYWIHVLTRGEYNSEGFSVSMLVKAWEGLVPASWGLANLIELRFLAMMIIKHWHNFLYLALVFLRDLETKLIFFWQDKCFTKTFEEKCLGQGKCFPLRMQESWWQWTEILLRGPGSSGHLSNKFFLFGVLRSVFPQQVAVSPLGTGIL